MEQPPGPPDARSARSWLFVPGDRADRFDKAAASGADQAAQPLLLARSSLMLASRVAGLPAPVDGVTQDLDDPAVAARDTAAALGLGFGGKLCVHPRQVAAVNAGFRPSEAAVRHAQQVLGTVTDGGPGRVGGQMVDRPVVERARQVLARGGIRPAPTT